ncbi:MAG TPA: LLM class flavin-dependent oxidoreductase [Baekduia sp.]|uniref:LLM class flavin-dependent oxidoreductase n=1 Tax=Baekduia sp. TaxID=2600305 RepID=UPI002D7920C5|nr:LLM class flavin-dependent oxidoreductase [Baekduia sp.]HET6507931.1 LLM class flavin-dependent oxidoreductase [Baekduia sp.]
MTAIGVNTFGAGFGPERFTRGQALARRAEAAGFDSVWVGELYSRSAPVPMAMLAAATRRVAVGTNIAYGVGRTPLMWAAEARDLDELSGGRVILGLGNGTTTMMERWHGVDGSSPAVRMEELVTVLRKLWRLHEGPVSHEGRFYRLDVRPTADTPPPFRERLPIYVAGVNPRMVEAAGRVSDGLVGHPMFTKAYIDDLVRPALAKGAAHAGRDVSEIAVCGVLMCSVDDDLDAARARLAFAAAQYAASRVYDRLFALHGWTAEQAAIRDAVRAGDEPAILAAMTDEILDAVGVVCRPGDLAAAVARHAADYDHLVLTPPPWGLTPEAAEAATVTLIDGMSERSLTSA